MRIAAVLLVLAAGVGTGTGSVGAADEPAFTDTLAITADTTLVFTLDTGSRLYPDWKEETTVRLNQEFHIGDTEFRATVKGFMPDFRIIDGRPRNVSAAMGNPAAFIEVRNDSAAVDSAWAFLNFPPHFSPTSFFTFQLKKVEGYQEPGAGTEEN